jgi:hypothetical protein
MSSFVSTALHFVDGDLRPCLMMDDFFGRRVYGIWFAKKGVKKINWDSPREQMEDIVYGGPNGELTKPAPEAMVQEVDPLGITHVALEGAADPAPTLPEILSDLVDTTEHLTVVIGQLLLELKRRTEE